MSDSKVDALRRNAILGVTWDGIVVARVYAALDAAEESARRAERECRSAMALAAQAQHMANYIAELLRPCADIERRRIESEPVVITQQMLEELGRKKP